MEIVLLWLDDLDDLVFSAALVLEQARRACLKIGFIAAVTLAACETFLTASVWAGMLALIAAGCVGLWTFAALVAAARRLDAGLV